MTKRRPAKLGQDSTISNGHHANLNGKLGSSVTSSVSSWMTPATLVKTAILVVIAAVGPVIVLKDFGFKGLGSGNFKSDPLSSSSLPLEPNGGWRLADKATVGKFGSDKCNIERVSVADLNPDRFESEYRFKKPVIVTFPHGARDWTDPRMWSLDSLNRSYGEWVMGFGNSLEIIRRGGNGPQTSTFSQFIDRISQEKNSTSGLPMYYIFDRDFYYDSSLPATIRLPPYFPSDKKQQDSIFFLGASGSGVVFHKHADTWNGVVFGKKRWFLYPMHHTPPGGVHHGYSILDWFELVYPNLTAEQRPLECVQEGGEILYLPEGFYHATLNIGDTIAVALQNKDPVLIEEKITYEVTNLVNVLDRPNSDAQIVNSKLLNKFLKLKELLPESAEVNMKLGDKYGDLDQHEKAIEYLQKAIDLDPYFVLAYTRLGASLSTLKRDDEAEKALKRAVELSPRVWDVYKEYSMFLMYKGRYAEAVPYLKKGAELNPDMMPFWSYLKQAQEKSGDVEGAKKTQEKIDQLTQMKENSN
ncbi:uncharacterized protein [Littorina saxatilis]|uniref:JmjC domain-containing protein n=2 Tax=Littorina saxatilis TaxID=31220 RepID=A0AAN9BAT1_9CAEN